MLSVLLIAQNVMYCANILFFQVFPTFFLENSFFFTKKSGMKGLYDKKPFIPEEQ